MTDKIPMSSSGAITYEMLVDAYLVMLSRHPYYYLSNQYPAVKVDTVQETIIGYQEAWRWFIYYPVLDRFRSIYKDHTWDQHHEQIADDIPSIDNTHGFYAFKPDDIQFEASEPVHNQYVYVFAKVALYGTVIEHEFGYRGEKARILQTWYPRSMPKYLAPKNWIPFVGCWYLESTTLYDAYDREVTRTWLTLENHNESGDSSPSNFPVQEVSQQSLTYGQIFRNGLSSPPPVRRRSRNRCQREGRCVECGERIEIWQVMAADKERHANCSYAPSWTRDRLPNPQLEEYLRPKVVLPDWIERGGLRLPIDVVLDQYETYWWLM